MTTIIITITIPVKLRYTKTTVSSIKKFDFDFPENYSSPNSTYGFNFQCIFLPFQKQIKMMYQNLGGPRFPSSPMRKARGETKKCRKVYGMEHREKWCTQCKWKKACTRFVGSQENAQLA